MAQVKLTFWSHWAAEKIKRDFVEDAIKRFEAANPGVKIEASVVREDRAVRGAQDRAARRHGAGHLLRRARPGRVHGERAAARPLVAELGGNRALGEGDLVVQGQAIRPAARGQHGRALLQQEAAGGPRRQGAGEPAARFRGHDRPVEKGARQEHDADVARRRRPAVSGRLPGAGSRC